MTYLYCGKYFSNIDLLRLYVLAGLLDEANVKYKLFCDQLNENVKCELMSDIKFKDDDIIAFVRADKWFIDQNFRTQKKLLFTKVPSFNNTLLFNFEADASYANQVKTLDLLFFCTEELLENICNKKKPELNDKAVLCLCNGVNKALADEDMKKNQRFQIGIWNMIAKFTEQLLSCSFIYTDNLDGIALSIALSKKMKFYFSHNKTETAKTNAVLKQLGIQLRGNAAVDNLHIQQQIQAGRQLLLSCIINTFNSLKSFKLSNMHVQANNMTIADYSTQLLANGTHPITFYNKKNGTKKNYDFAVIQAFFGDEKSALHITATKNAIALNLQYSNDKPKQWIFIEYNTHEFEYLKQYGIEYYHICKNPKSVGLFMKECLWNIAWRKYAKSENLCFIDADIIYLDCDWVKKTYDGFKKFDAFQNFSHSVRSEINDGVACVDEGVCYRYCINKELEEKNQTANKTSKGQTGFNICLKKYVIRKIGGFPNCPNCGGDFMFMFQLLSYVDASFPLYLDHHAKKGYQFNRVFEKELNISYVDSIVLHHKHSNTSKDYNIFNMIQRRCGSYYSLLIRTDKADLIEWADSSCARVCRNSIQKLNATSTDITYDVAEKIIQQETLKEYGTIDDEHPLLFVTCFNPGINISTKQVKQTKALFDKYCLDKHDFVCITNEKIDGIKCVPINALDITSADFQMEMWRCDYFADPNTSVMYIDLDIVPLDYFRIPRCPKDTIWMIDENQHTESYGTKYNFGCIYFNGDFSFIYKEIVANFDKMYKYYNDLQPFVTHLLLNHNININNLYNFMNLKFIDFRWYTIPNTDNCKFIHFIGPIKPWNFKQKQQYQNIVNKNKDLIKIRKFYK